MEINHEPFEGIVYEANMPASTLTFLVKQGTPLGGGLYEIRRIRAVTDEDNTRFAHEIAMNDADYQRREAAGEFA